MMNLIELLRLALGEAESRKVDTAIPQAFFDSLSQTERLDVAGWYYDAAHKCTGRLLTRTECWEQIRQRLALGSLIAVVRGYQAEHTATNGEMAVTEELASVMLPRWHFQIGEGPNLAARVAALRVLVEHDVIGIVHRAVPVPAGWQRIEGDRPLPALESVREIEHPTPEVAALPTQTLTLTSEQIEPHAPSLFDPVDPKWAAALNARPNEK